MAEGKRLAASVDRKPMFRLARYQALQDRRASLATEAWLPCRCPCLATRRGGGQRQLLHVGPARVLSAAGTFTLGEDAIGIYLALEPR